MVRDSKEKNPRRSRGKKPEPKSNSVSEKKTSKKSSKPKRTPVKKASPRATTEGGFNTKDSRLEAFRKFLDENENNKQIDAKQLVKSWRSIKNERDALTTKDIRNYQLLLKRARIKEGDTTEVQKLIAELEDQFPNTKIPLLSVQPEVLTKSVLVSVTDDNVQLLKSVIRTRLIHSPISAVLWIRQLLQEIVNRGYVDSLILAIVKDLTEAFGDNAEAQEVLRLFISRDEELLSGLLDIPELKLVLELTSSEKKRGSIFEEETLVSILESSISEIIERQISFLFGEELGSLPGIERQLLEIKSDISSLVRHSDRLVENLKLRFRSLMEEAENNTEPLRHLAGKFEQSLQTNESCLEYLADRRVLEAELDDLQKRPESEYAPRVLRKILLEIRRDLSSLAQFTGRLDSGFSISKENQEMLVRVISNLFESLGRAGISQIGNVGEITKYDSAIHRCGVDKAMEGSRITIIECGWQIDTDSGWEVMEKAYVAPCMEENI